MKPPADVPLYAVILLPDFALQSVLRHSPDLWESAVGLIAEKTPKARIFQLTAQARAAGVTCGMTPSQALARCAALTVKIQSAPAEKAAAEALLESGFGCSPFVEATAPGICTLRWGAHAEPGRPLSQLAALHLRARLGIAPNADLALLAAQSAEGPGTWRRVEHARELSDLPLEKLGPPPALLAVLAQWGIRSLGEFVALGREPLAQRLGSEVLPFFDRASGRIERPLRCVPPPESFEEGAEFEQEIETLEPLLFIARRFLEQIALRLEAVWLVAAELQLRLGFARGTPAFYERAFHIPSPTRDVDLLFRLLHTHLENFRAEHPIVSLHLGATPSRPWRQQFGLFESALRDPNQFFETLARLGALLGRDRVGTPQLLATHRPDAFKVGPVCFGQPPHGPAPAPLRSLPETAGLSLRRFRPARPARVRFEERPLAIQSAEASGLVLAAFGPVLLSGDWWNGAPWSRREWDIQLREGLLCRIFEEENAWFLDGIYD